jgi:hypothetical protein
MERIRSSALPEYVPRLLRRDALPLVRALAGADPYPGTSNSPSSSGIAQPWVALDTRLICHFSFFEPEDDDEHEDDSDLRPYAAL